MRVFVWLTLMTAGVAPTAASNVFEPGDIVVVIGAIIDCGEAVGVLDFGQVDLDGDVHLFEERMAHDKISIRVQGMTESEVSDSIADQIEKSESYRPGSIQVDRVTVRELIRRHRKGDVLGLHRGCIEQFLDPEAEPERRQRQYPGIEGPNPRDLPPSRYKMAQVAVPDFGVRLTLGCSRGLTASSPRCCPDRLGC